MNSLMMKATMNHNAAAIATIKKMVKHHKKFYCALYRYALFSRKCRLDL